MERLAIIDENVSFVKGRCKMGSGRATGFFILGSPQFVSWIWEKTNGSEELKEHPREERIVGRPTLEEIFSDVKTKEERDDAIVLARVWCGYLVTEIGRHLGLDPSTVGKLCRSVYENS